MRRDEVRQLKDPIKFIKKLNQQFILYCVVLITLTSCSTNGNSAATPSETSAEMDEKIAIPSEYPEEADEQSAIESSFVQLEEEYGAKLGVFAIDTGTGRSIAYRPDERFAYASTYKALAAGLILMNSSADELDQVITYTKDDLVSYSPVTEKHLKTGMTIRDICEAAVRYSDNTAGNILLKKLGGPEGYEKALKQIGDQVTQADRYEPELNEAVPGDTRDTSTPRSLATTLSSFIVGNVLTDDKRSILIDWMSGNATGDELIRAGAPKDWKVADKSGAGNFGTRNDIAIVWPPNGSPIIVAIMSNRDVQDADYDNALIAQAAKVALDSLIVE